MPTIVGMAHIVQRRNRLYVVAYDGIDPNTGRERRRWHAVGNDPTEAEAVAARLHRTPRTPAQRHRTETTLKGFLTNVWLRRKRPNLRSTTAYRYSWMIERYIAPRLGEVPLRQLRDDHLDDLYNHLIGHGGKGGAPLSPKTVHEVHLIVRNALDLAVTRHLVDTNVARAVHSPRRRGGGPVVARVWDARELAEFLVFAGHHRLYPLLHLAAHTGMRRGELAGLQWRDLDSDRSRLSVTRTIQSVAGRPTIFGVKTRTSCRTVDLDNGTLGILLAWRTRLKADGLPSGADDWMFCVATRPAVTSTPNRRASCSGGSCASRDCPSSGSTTSATRTPRCSLPPACRSRWSPNDSATRTRRSRCTPTSTSYRA